MHYCRRLGGIMVSALDSGPTGPGLSPGRGDYSVVLCSRARYFTLTELLFTQEYKWVPATKCWG